MDALTIDRDPLHLQPAASKIALEWDRRCHESGLLSRFTETWRSQARQASLGPNSTSVKLGYHCVGLAWDFGIFEKNSAGVWIMVQNGDDPRYAAAGKIAVDLGCKYGIHLLSGQVDHDHIEYHPGFTLAQFLATAQGQAALKGPQA